MPRMLGDRVLPTSVQQKRQQLRNRVSSLREPIKDFREQNVPGPDVVNKAETSVSSLRDRFVSREMVLSRLKDMKSSGSNGESQPKSKTGSTTSSSSTNNGSNRTPDNSSTIQ